MEPNFYNLFLSASVFLIFGIICTISMIFTFSLETYHKIDDLFNFEMFSMRSTHPLDIQIRSFEDWLKRQHKIIGFMLTILSLLDAVMLSKIIKSI